ncbi:MAG: hypothetical protein WC209_15630 [Ignavibacteriaceae bacterium]|jgi:hypothetical protein
MENQLSFNKEDSANSESACRFKEVISGKLVQCLEKNPSCNNSFYFGTAIFCKKPIQQELKQNSPAQSVSPTFTIFNNDPESF